MKQWIEVGVSELRLESVSPCFGPGHEKDDATSCGCKIKSIPIVLNSVADCLAKRAFDSVQQDLVLVDLFVEIY